MNVTDLTPKRQEKCGTDTESVHNGLQPVGILSAIKHKIMLLFNSICVIDYNFIQQQKVRAQVFFFQHARWFQNVCERLLNFGQKDSLSRRKHGSVPQGSKRFANGSRFDVTKRDGSQNQQLQSTHTELKSHAQTFPCTLQVRLAEEHPTR